MQNGGKALRFGKLLQKLVKIKIISVEKNTEFKSFIGAAMGVSAGLNFGHFINNTLITHVFLYC